MPVPVRTTAWAQASVDDEECRQQLGSLTYTETMPANLGSQDLVPTPRCSSHREAHVSFSLFPVACCYPDNKNQPHKTGSRPFLLPPAYLLGLRNGSRVGGRGGGNVTGRK